MFQVFHIGGLLQFEYLAANDKDTRWSINRLSISAVSGEDRSRWEVELQSDDRRAVVGWNTFLTLYRPADGTADSVSALITHQLDGVEAALSERVKSGGIFSIFARSRSRYESSETLWSPDGTYRQWILPGIVIESGQHQQEREIVQALLLGIAADRTLIQAGTKAAKAGTQKTALPLAGQPPSLDEDLQPLMDDYRETFFRNLDQALMNSRNLLSLSERSNSPSSIESVVNSTLHGAISMALLELGAQMFPEQQLDVQCHVGDGTSEASLAGESFTAMWTADLPVWSNQLLTTTSVDAQVSLLPGSRSDKAQVSSLMEIVRMLLSDWLDARNKPLATGGDGWVSLLPQTPWNAEVFAIWLGMATPKQKLTRLLDVVQQTSTGPDPHQNERATALQQLAEAVVSESATFDLDGWQVVSSSLQSLPEAQQSLFLDQLNQVVRRRISQDACGPLEAGSWIGIWHTASHVGDQRQASILEAVTQRCARQADPNWSALLIKLWTDLGAQASQVPDIAAALMQAKTIRPEWTAQLAEALEASDARRTTYTLLYACTTGAGNGDAGFAIAPLFPLAESSAQPDTWTRVPEAKELVSTAVDTWAKELDRSQDVVGWQNLVTHRDQLRKLGLYQD